MRFWLLTGLLLVSSPAFASAATFAKQSLFLSKNPVTEGETVIVHAIVANESNVKFAGEVVFKDGSAKMGSVAVSMAAGGASAVSLSWKPTAGPHSVVAQLTASDATVVESETETFTILAKPTVASANNAAASTAAVVDSSADIQKKISDLSPTVGSISAPVFTTLDSVRAKAADVLDNGISWAKQKSGNKTPGQILGAATSTTPSGIMDTVWTMVGTVFLYIFTALRFIVGNAGIFYPVFAIAFFYTLWKLYKRMTRPRFPVYE